MLYHKKIKPPKAYMNTTPKYMKFRDKWHLCIDWNKLLPRLCEEIYHRHYDAATIDLFRSELIALSQRPNAPKFAELFYERYSYIKVNGLSMYVRTSLSAEQTVIQARTLISNFGYSDSDLEFIVE